MNNKICKFAMEKILKTMLGGFVLCMVLCVLFPRAFLNGDALWTYQSNAGRVDVAFAGDIQNGRLEVRGDNVRAGEPKWLLDNRHNQGVVLSFPVSYLRETYQVTLEPQGDVKEVSLMMSFRGQDLRIRNQRKSAYVCFENIRINGKAVAEEQTVWHDKPFRYHAKNISDNSVITLSFDIRKPLSYADFRWERVIELFIICMLFVFCYFGSFEGIGKRISEFFYVQGMLQMISERYSRIDVVYRRSFWIIFGVLCFAFGYHTIEFMWGNHDWELVGGLSSLPWDGRAFEGRYAVYFIKKLFLKGTYLPLIYDVVSFLILAFNGVLLCIYWKLEKRVTYFVLCGLILTAQPFTLSMMYFVHMLPEAFIGVTLTLIALMLAEKLAFEKSSRMRKVVFSFLSIVLVNLSLAMYPVLINTIAVAFVGRLLVQSFEWDGSWKQFKSHLISFSIPAICIALGIGLYKFMITFVFPLDKNFYNVKTLPLEQLPDRLFTLLKQCVTQLCEYNLPFISQAVLWVFLGFTILIAMHIVSVGGGDTKIIKNKLIMDLSLFDSDSYDSGKST